MLFEIDEVLDLNEIPGLAATHAENKWSRLLGLKKISLIYIEPDTIVCTRHYSLNTIIVFYSVIE